MAEYKFHYFNARAKGELIRLTFAAAGVDYEDMRYNMPLRSQSSDCLEWNDEAKAATPLGQLPVLEVGGEKFCQQTAIARFVARKHGLMGNNDQQAFKVDMVLETMWPDIASKCFGIFWEQDEVKKAAMKDKLGKAIPVTLEKISQWIQGDFMLGAKLSLADIAIVDAMSVVQNENFFPDLELPDAIAKVIENVKANAGVRKWLETRPVTQF